MYSFYVLNEYILFKTKVYCKALHRDHTNQLNLMTCMNIFKSVVQISNTKLRFVSKEQELEIGDDAWKVVSCAFFIKHYWNIIVILFAAWQFSLESIQLLYWKKSYLEYWNCSRLEL